MLDPRGLKSVPVVRTGTGKNEARLKSRWAGLHYAIEPSSFIPTRNARVDRWVGTTAGGESTRTRRRPDRRSVAPKSPNSRSNRWVFFVWAHLGGEEWSDADGFLDRAIKQGGWQVHQIRDEKCTRICNSSPDRAFRCAHRLGVGTSGPSGSLFLPIRNLLRGISHVSPCGRPVFSDPENKTRGWYLGCQAVLCAFMPLGEPDYRGRSITIGKRIAG